MPNVLANRRAAFGASRLTAMLGVETMNDEKSPDR